MATNGKTKVDVAVLQERMRLFEIQNSGEHDEIKQMLVDIKHDVSAVVNHSLLNTQFREEHEQFHRDEGWKNWAKMVVAGGFAAMGVKFL